MSTCKICNNPLVVELDLDLSEFDEATGTSSSTQTQTQTLTTVPDDLELLGCGDHFHWQCLLDESASIIASMTCPSCNQSISAPSTPQLKVLARYHNEGGIQENLDIYPLINEEAYLVAHPTARPARAYITMCAEGDITGIVELLNAVEEDSDEGDLTPSGILRYQDPLDGMKTGLHVAMEKEQEEVVWLLLWLASPLPANAFPEEVSSIAETLGARRDTALQGSDIRGIRDEGGNTAGDVARRMGGGVWNGLLGAGIL